MGYGFTCTPSSSNSKENSYHLKNNDKGEPNVETQGLLYKMYSFDSRVNFRVVTRLIKASKQQNIQNKHLSNQRLKPTFMIDKKPIKDIHSRQSPLERPKPKHPK